MARRLNCAARESMAWPVRAAIQPSDLFERLSINATLFPRGIDVVLVAGDAIAAIPRTTRLAGKGG